MKEKLTKVLSDIRLDELVGLPYAMAAWKLPNSPKRYVAISLWDGLKSVESLEHLTSGFLINRFEDHHPIKPEFFPADLLIQDNEVTISPNVSSELIDTFLEVLSVSKIEIEYEIPKVGSTDYRELVQHAINEIKSGAFDKVVLARYDDMDLPEDFSIGQYFDRLCANYDASFCSLLHIPGQGIWIGASPEILISTNGNTFKTVSLAATKKLDEDQNLASLAWTQKEIEEQAFVSRYIINCFKKIRLREFNEYGPKAAKAGNLAHLKTEYTVDLTTVNFDDLPDQMLSLLHPTSAVCGMPLDIAKDFIQRNEGFDREYYSGFLGPVNIDGATHQFVNLRCMKIFGSKARFFAGAGITEDSNPDDEFRETDLKMAVLKRLI